MMTVDNSALMMEVNAIQTETVDAPQHMWEGTLHAGDRDIQILKIKEFVRTRDYASNKADKLGIVAMLGFGDYNQYVRTYRGQLEITLRRLETSKRTATELIGTPISVERFRAVPPEEPENSMYDSLSVDINNVEAANTAAVIDLSLEMMSPTIERLRGVTVGGIFRAKNVGELLRTILTVYSRLPDVDNIRQVRGVDLIETFNDTPRTHYVIDHGAVTLLDFPKYVQEQCGGVYASGIGYYLQDYLWYVYPLYDVTRFNNELSTLTVLLVPENKLPRLERSYRLTNNQLTVIITTAPYVVDDTETIQYNSGNGIRFADANTIMEGFGVAQNNQYRIEKGKNVTEVKANQRAEGNNMVLVSDVPVHANPFVEYSRLARANTVHIQFEWINSDDSLLYPGMPTRILRWADNEMREEFGTLLGSEAFNRMADNLQSNQYIQQTVLTVGVKKSY